MERALSSNASASSWLPAVRETGTSGGIDPRGRGSPPARRNRRRKLRVDASTMDALYLGAAVIKLVLSDSVVANMKREAFVGVLRSGRAAAARAISSVPAASIATSVANDMLTVESFVTDTGKAQTSGAAAAIELEKARQRRHTDVALDHGQRRHTGVALDHGQRRRVQRHIIVRHSFFENSHVVILVRGLDPVKAV